MSEWQNQVGIDGLTAECMLGTTSSPRPWGRAGFSVVTLAYSKLSVTEVTVSYLLDW